MSVVNSVSIAAGGGRLADVEDLIHRQKPIEDYSEEERCRLLCIVVLG